MSRTEQERPFAPRPLGRRRLPDEIAEQLSEMIVSGRFSAGDQLPTEATLTAEFGVGRSAVREAIAKLREAGLVETRHGVGAFVSSDPTPASFRIDAGRLQSIEALRQVLELRMEIEVAGAAMAARRRTLAQMALIDEAFAAMRARLEAGDAAVAEQREFQRVVAAAARHPDKRH